MRRSTRTALLAACLLALTHSAAHAWALWDDFEQCVNAEFAATVERDAFVDAEARLDACIDVVRPEIEDQCGPHYTFNTETFAETLDARNNRGQYVNAGQMCLIAEGFRAAVHVPTPSLTSSSRIGEPEIIDCPSRTIATYMGVSHEGTQYRSTLYCRGCCEAGLPASE